MKHVRKTNANVTDHRFRSTSKFNNKPRPNFCGAEPTHSDLSKGDAVHIITKFANLRPAWVAEICLDCRAAVMS